MGNIIQLLPDTIANQIAAGEVIQRPASVLKELVENAVDAGATEINVNIKGAGKTAMIVTDNGKGMNPTDARMSLERHATSKIANAADLFAINTMGFRGEAMASIAAIAHMEIKTKEAEANVGTHLKINGGEIEFQEPAPCANGTQTSVKNLFYNVPARRKFLKSDNVEMRHIIDQFERIAIPHPHIKFTLQHNGADVFQLPAGNLRQRLVGIFGKKYNEKLVPIQQETPVVNISGFVVKPEAAKKSRGEQFFFVNNRYIKNGFLHTMVMQSFEELIPKGMHPGYFIFLDVDPGFIDINIHPTKTEIKFEDERTIGLLMRSSVKQAIGMHNVAPSLDFDAEMSFSTPPPKDKVFREPKISVNEGFNPFNTGSSDTSANAPQSAQIQSLQSMYQDLDTLVSQPNELDSTPMSGEQLPAVDEEKIEVAAPKAFQVRNKYIVSTTKNGMLIINQTRAHQRILFDQYVKQLENSSGISQQLLFPENVTFNSAQSEQIKALAPDLVKIGFDIEPFGVNTFIVRGLPANAANEDPRSLIEGILFGYDSHVEQPNMQQHEALAISIAFKTAIKTGKSLSQEEINALIDELFASANPQSLPDGRKIFHQQHIDDIDKLFS